MSPAKINELFDVLRAACSRQYGFNPRQITSEMRYVGTEGHGKDLLHIFRDAHTHSQIALKNTFVTLREKQGDKPHWTEAEKAHYKKTNAVLDAEAAARQAELDFAHTCQLYIHYRQQLLAHYKAWPGYQEGGPTPHEAARVLLQTLAEGKDERLTELAEHVASTDHEHLIHLLLAVCHRELDALPKA